MSKATPYTDEEKDAAQAIFIESWPDHLAHTAISIGLDEMSEVDRNRLLRMGRWHIATVDALQAKLDAERLLMQRVEKVLAGHWWGINCHGPRMSDELAAAWKTALGED